MYAGRIFSKGFAKKAQTDSLDAELGCQGIEVIAPHRGRRLGS